MGFGHVGAFRNSVSRLLPNVCRKCGSTSYRIERRHSWFNMREEFASYSFLALTVAGIVLLGAGLVAFAIT